MRRALALAASYLTACGVCAHITRATEVRRFDSAQDCDTWLRTRYRRSQPEITTWNMYKDVIWNDHVLALGYTKQGQEPDLQIIGPTLACSLIALASSDPDKIGKDVLDELGVRRAELDDVRKSPDWEEALFGEDDMNAAAISFFRAASLTMIKEKTTWWRYHGVDPDRVVWQEGVTTPILMWLEPGVTPWRFLISPFTCIRGPGKQCELHF